MRKWPIKLLVSCIDTEHKLCQEPGLRASKRCSEDRFLCWLLLDLALGNEGLLQTACPIEFVLNHHSCCLRALRQQIIDREHMRHGKLTSWWSTNIHKSCKKASCESANWLATKSKKRKSQWQVQVGVLAFLYLYNPWVLTNTSVPANEAKTHQKQEEGCNDKLHKKWRAKGNKGAWHEELTVDNEMKTVDKW